MKSLMTRISVEERENRQRTDNRKRRKERRRNGWRGRHTKRKDLKRDEMLTTLTDHVLNLDRGNFMGPF